MKTFFITVAAIIVADFLLTFLKGFKDERKTGENVNSIKIKNRF
jgi:hypothetical protein